MSKFCRTLDDIGIDWSVWGFSGGDSHVDVMSQTDPNDYLQFVFDESGKFVRVD